MKDALSLIIRRCLSFSTQHFTLLLTIIYNFVLFIYNNLHNNLCDKKFTLFEWNHVIFFWYNTIKFLKSINWTQSWVFHIQHQQYSSSYKSTYETKALISKRQNVGAQKTYDTFRENSHSQIRYRKTKRKEGDGDALFSNLASLYLQSDKFITQFSLSTF